MTIAPPDPSPPEFLQIAGHPLRWRLLADLARSDRTVRDLTGVVDEPQNLVSYHLRKLRDAGLVTSRRSSADGRDAYYRADLPRLRSMVSATGGALHPGLRVIPEPWPTDQLATARVLFLCTGNSARSQMAEALVQVRSGGAIHAASAGSHPKPLHPNAIRVMRDEYGIDLSGRTSKHLEVFAEQPFDLVVTLCDRVREVCPDFPGTPDPIHWSMPDPSAGCPEGDDAASYPAFSATAAEIDERIGFLLPALAPSTPAPRTRPRGEP